MSDAAAKSSKKSPAKAVKKPTKAVKKPAKAVKKPGNAAKKQPTMKMAPTAKKSGGSYSRSNQLAFVRPMKMTAIYDLKIIVCESKPMIWRRVQVPKEFTLWELHYTIMEVMGWLKYNNFEFSVPNLTDPEGYGSSIFPSDKKEMKTKLDVYLKEKNDSISYIYDNGFWDHAIVLTNILPVGRNSQYPKVIGGRRACPPEDIHGAEQYSHQLKVLKDPNHEEYEDVKSWFDDVAEDFDPETFEKNEVAFDRLDPNLPCEPKREDDSSTSSTDE